MNVGLTFYVIGHISYYMVSLFSRIANAALFKGSMHQTFSARAWIESHDGGHWLRRREIIDRVFFFEPGHCEKAWAAEVERARKTLERNRATGPYTTARPTTGANKEA